MADRQQSDEELTERRSAILRHVVSDYVETAEPVSSKALVDRYELGVSSATVRNELARLEDEGYVTHPHTSAGRIPSELGYRYYVRSLMDEEPVPDDERRTIEHQLHQVIGALDDWLSLAATILAASVHNVAIVTRPRMEISAFRHFQMVELHGNTVLLVVVMEDGRVRQRVLNLSQPYPQAELSERSERLNARLAHRSVALDDDLPLADADDALVVASVVELLDEHNSSEDTFLDGLRSLLQQPEFASADRVVQAVQSLEAYSIHQLLQHAEEEAIGQTRVLIGLEHGDASMQDWSLILTNYGDGEGAVGTVAVLGPTRMRYERAIPRVRYVARLMSNLLEEVR
jgi:heat-inducible transcriptional repressor